MKRILPFFVCVIFFRLTNAQAPDIEWQRSVGGNFYDRIQDIIGLEDGSYFAVGITSDTTISSHHGADDCWAVKLDSIGNTLWQKCYGGTSFDYALSTKQTADKGFIIAGSTKSNNGDITSNHGSDDFWIIKIDSIGNLLWQKCYGGSSSDGAFSVELTKDGGYIICGGTISNDGDVTPNVILGQYWVVKVDSVGNKEWAKSFGGPSSFANSIKVCSDNGYIFGGVDGYVFKTTVVRQN